MGSPTGQDLASGPDRAATAPGPDVVRLSAAIAKGENAALDEFYRAWFDRCFAMARGITRRDEAFCLDVVQEAMLRVVKSMRAMRSEDEVSRWMRRVVHSAALDRLREERRRTARDQRTTRSDGVGGDGSDAADLVERIAWVREQLGAMESEERAVLVMRIGAGRTLEEAGAGAGITGDAAHGRVRRMLKKLRAAAKEVFGE